MTDPYISVITLFYNSEKTIARTLEAFAKQTFRDFEIVFVDNGSRDNSRRLVEEFIRNNDIMANIVTIEENNGIVPGRNAGLDAAKGVYFIYNDADDWMNSNCLELLASRAKETNADRIMSSFVQVGDNGAILRYDTVTDHMNGSCLGVYQGSLFKRDIVTSNEIKIGFPLYEDAMFCIQFNQASDSISVVDKHLYNYYFNTSSLTRKNNSPNSIKRFDYQIKNSQTLKMIYEKTSDEDKKDIIEYSELLLYYSTFAILVTLPSLRKGISQYFKLRKNEKNLFPNYLKNPYLCSGEKRITFEQNYKMVRIMSTAERFHIFPILFFLYWLLKRISSKPFISSNRLL